MVRHTLSRYKFRADKPTSLAAPKTSYYGKDIFRAMASIYEGLLADPVAFRGIMPAVSRCAGQNGWLDGFNAVFALEKERGPE